MTKTDKREKIDILVGDIQDKKLALEKAEIDQERGQKWIDKLKQDIEEYESELEVLMGREMKGGDFTSSNE